MHDDALQHVDLALPRLLGEHAPRVVQPGLPAVPDAGAGEVDVLGVILAVEARRQLASGAHIGDVTYAFQRAVADAGSLVVAGDMAGIRADLAELGELDHADPFPIAVDAELNLPVVDEAALTRLAERDLSPLAALEEVERLVAAVES